MILLFKNVRRGGGPDLGSHPNLSIFKNDDVIVLVAINS